MNQDLLERFERFEVAPGAFDHRGHVEVAFAMLQRYSFAEATARYVGTIRRMADSAGVPEKFHMTITVAFMALIAERVAAEPGVDFATFCDRHADLLDARILRRFYSDERLRSPAAKKVFLLPDFAASPV